ncbi:hypothetical protein [Microtetraspora sp. NBRC 16547]|uniref:hypothetical protein n=1 Tax=Microtetraspora sp. NBRC 16547 TaxID=3030993 RepID=UPI0024A43B3B|nr:hypothetical protein [Microtetraspora sp. NBRC 16547]GLW99977.1 hypothetical protein Misp02_40640 [Microtetraspora sp. NBRC 16547]
MNDIYTSADGARILVQRYRAFLEKLPVLGDDALRGLRMPTLVILDFLRSPKEARPHA